jgi:dihydroorotate dehydrogenase (fumarate)
MTSVDLRTRYLGMELSSPLVASASPLCAHLDLLRRVEEAGAGAVVMQSLFEEQIEHESLDLHSLLANSEDRFPEAQDMLPELDDYNTGPAAYLEYLEAVKRSLQVPVIASLNGSSIGGWVRYAKAMKEAGADALELNVYFVPTDPDTTSQAVEDRYVELVAAVRAATDLPLAVKIGPYFSAMPHMARRLVEAGADGLVLFNRFLQPDLDLETLEVVPHLELSTPSELRLPLRWIAILRGQLTQSLAATTGVHSAEDALKMILSGADVVMMTSALLRRGPEFLRLVLDGVETWLEANGYASVDQARGSVSRNAVAEPEAFERSNYMQALVSYSSHFRG